MSFALGTQPTTEVDGVNKCSFMLPARAFPRPHQRASCLQRRCVMLIEAFNETTGEIIAAAIEVHRALGPRLLESTYSECLQMELAMRRLRYVTQHTLPIVYKGRRLDTSTARAPRTGVDLFAAHRMSRRTLDELSRGEANGRGEARR